MTYGMLTAETLRQVLPGSSMDVKCDDCKAVFAAAVSGIELNTSGPRALLCFSHSGDCPVCGSSAPGAYYPLG